MDEKSQERFDIGLTCAGAVSAGAYTAGVISFLFEALNAFYLEKKKDELNNFPFQVKLKAMSGASAGGMCAALTAVSICDGNNSKFKKSWVEDIDLKKLLDDADLISNPVELRAILNCSILDQIASSAINIGENSNHWADFLDEYIDLLLTVTNVNGITYTVETTGDSGKYFVKNHADYMHFRLYPAGNSPNDGETVVRNLDATSAHSLDNWTLLQQSAKATGAFPMALESRKIKRAQTDYKNRKISGLQPDTVTVNPVFDKNAPASFDYLFVDGGMTNNEPFQLVHDIIAQKNENNINPQKPEEANAAILLVDPFPDFSSDFTTEPLQQGVLKMISPLFGTLRQQSKFKVDELLKAMDGTIYSRFMIAPKRNKFPDEIKVSMRDRSHVAGGTLGAFGGFIDRNFRQHDYDLGRRNCQKFLMSEFVLDADNKLFTKWKDKNPAQFESYIINDNGKRFLPIIPLVNQALKTEIPEPAWPKTTQQNIDDIKTLIDKRLCSTIDYTLDALKLSKILELVIKPLKSPVVNYLTKKAMESINDDLDNLCMK